MFEEKEKEINSKGIEVEPIKTPKYAEATAKATKLLGANNSNLIEGDFSIFKTESQKGDVYYKGLILSHDGCLKMNECLPQEFQFKPESVTLDKNGYDNSLVFAYINKYQGIYEIGEVNPIFCLNPYTTALNRLTDRVILKNAKLAPFGIYSEAENVQILITPPPFDCDLEEIRNARPDGPIISEKTVPVEVPATTGNIRADLVNFCKANEIDILEVSKMYQLNNEAPEEDFKKAFNYCRCLANINSTKEGK